MRQSRSLKKGRTQWTLTWGAYLSASRSNPASEVSRYITTTMHISETYTLNRITGF